MSHRPVRFTNHALYRSTSYHVPEPDLREAWSRSFDYQLPAYVVNHKINQYGAQVLSDFYRYDYQSQLLFTCSRRKDHDLVVTVTKKSFN